MTTLPDCPCCDNKADPRFWYRDEMFCDGCWPGDNTSKWSRQLIDRIVDLRAEKGRLREEIDVLKTDRVGERVRLDAPLTWTEFLRSHKLTPGTLVWFRSRRDPFLVGDMMITGGGFDGRGQWCDCFDPDHTEKVTGYQVIWPATVDEDHEGEVADGSADEGDVKLPREQELACEIIEQATRTDKKLWARMTRVATLVERECDRVRAEERERGLGTAKESFDKIAKLCGCAHWSYSSQVVRDVEDVVALLQQARGSLGLSLRSADEDNALGERIDKILGAASPHTWVVETVDDGAAGEGEFWRCSGCGASGGAVDNPAVAATLRKAFGTEPPSLDRRGSPFLAGPAMPLSTNCKLAAQQIANYHTRPASEEP